MNGDLHPRRVREILCPVRKKDMPSLAMLIAMNGPTNVADSKLNTLSGKQRRRISEVECFGCCGDMVWAFSNNDSLEILPSECDMVDLSDG